MPETRDLIGERFGNIVVLGKSFRRRGRQYWLCQCDCGIKWDVIGDRLTRANDPRRAATNCFDCGRKKARAKLLKYDVLVGDGKNRLYNVFQGMKRRCTDNRPRYARRYKDRGINICQEWLEGGYAVFRDWALANGYTDDLTIDRIDNDKGYSPENCRWATPKQQMENREMTIKLEFDGQVMTIREAVSYHNNVVSLDVARRRIRDGWEPLKAFTTPKLTRKGVTAKSDPSEWIKYPPESFSTTLLAEYEEK